MDTRPHETIRPAGAPTIDPHGPGVPGDDPGLMDRMSEFVHERGAAGAVAEARDATGRRPVMAAAIAAAAIVAAVVTVLLVRR